MGNQIKIVFALLLVGMIDSLRTFHAIDIASETESVPRESYEDSIPEYEEKDWDFMPMLKEREYYNVPEEDWGEIREEQFVSGGSSILKVMERLQENPFLLIRNNSGLHIITKADLNRRKVKEMIYPIKSQLEDSISRLISEHYSNENLKNSENVKNSTKSFYSDAKGENVNLDFVEFLSLFDMKKLVRNDEDLRKECGLESKEEAEKKIGKAEDVRNKVMHGNRSLILNHGELTIGDMIDGIRYSQEIIKNLQE